jgi:hypothetical protein
MALDLRPNQMKGGRKTIQRRKFFGQMKEHNQGLFCNIEILTSFSKKIRIISRIYNRGPTKKMFRKRKKNWMQPVATMATGWITALQLVS